MQITRIEQIGKKCQVWLNDEPAFFLYPSEVRRFHLREGEELPEELRAQIFREVLLKRASLRCMHLLKSSDRTESQLRLKLRQDGYPAEIIDSAIDYVKGYHYVDDFRYAKAFVETRSGRFSRRQLRGSLQSRGIPQELIEEALEQIAPEDEERQIALWLEKKHFDPSLASREEADRMMRFLLRKGYSYAQVRQALGGCKGKADDEY